MAAAGAVTKTSPARPLTVEQQKLLRLLAQRYLPVEQYRRLPAMQQLCDLCYVEIVLNVPGRFGEFLYTLSEPGAEWVARDQRKQERNQ